MLPGSLDPGASGAVHLYGSLFGTVTAAVLFRPGTVTTAENYIPSSVSLTGNLYFLEDLIKEAEAGSAFSIATTGEGYTVPSANANVRKCGHVVFALLTVVGL